MRGDDTDFDNRMMVFDYSRDNLITPKRKIETIKNRSTKQKEVKERPKSTIHSKKSTVPRKIKSKSPKKMSQSHIPIRSYNPQEQHSMFDHSPQKKKPSLDNSKNNNKINFSSLEEMYEEDGPASENPFKVQSPGYNSEEPPLSAKDYENYMFDSMEELIIEMVDSLLKTKGTVRKKLIYFSYKN